MTRLQIAITAHRPLQTANLLDTHYPSQRVEAFHLPIPSLFRNACATRLGIAVPQLFRLFRYPRELLSALLLLPSGRQHLGMAQWGFRSMTG